MRPGGGVARPRGVAPRTDPGRARRAPSCPSDERLGARHHDLVAGAQAGLDLEPVAAVDAQRERAPVDDVAAGIDDERERLLGCSAPRPPTGTTGMLRVRLDDDRAAAVHARVELARAVVELHLGVQRARRRIERGREAHDLARERLARQRVDLDVGVLARRATPASSRSLTVMNTRSVSTRATVTIAPPPGGPTSVARIEAALHDDARQRRGDARLAQAHRQRARSAPARGLLRGLGGRELALRLLQLLLRHDRLGRQLLGALVVGARQRRRRLRLRQRAARGRQLIGQIAGSDQRQQLARA